MTALGMGRFKTALIVGLVASGSTLAAAAPRDLVPPLSERTIGALRKACSPTGLEHLTQNLVLRRDAGQRAAKPFAWDRPEPWHDPTGIGGVNPWPFCNRLDTETGLVTWLVGEVLHG